MQVKAVFFDVDGMLIPKQYRLSTQLERDYGIRRPVTASFFENEFQLCKRGKADLKQELKKYLGSWGWKQSVDDLLEYWFKSEHHLDKRVIGVVKQLRARRVLCCVTSNQEKYRALYLTQDMGFETLFDHLFFSAYIGYQKPEKEFFDYVIGQLKGIKKNEVLFWDDDQENVAALQSLGFKSKHYTDFNTFKRVMINIMGTET